MVLCRTHRKISIVGGKNGHATIDVSTWSSSWCISWNSAWTIYYTWIEEKKMTSKHITDIFNDVIEFIEESNETKHYVAMDDMGRVHNLLFKRLYRKFNGVVPVKLFQDKKGLWVVRR